MWQRLSAVRMFIENVYPSQINPDVEQIILKLWKVRNRINLVYHVYLKVHTLWLYLLLIINPTRSVGHLQIHSFIYAQKLFSWENTSLVVQLPVNIQSFLGCMFFLQFTVGFPSEHRFRDL